MRSMNSAGRVVLLLAASLTLSSCSPEPSPACDEYRPAGYDRTCGGDGECSAYLKCIDGACSLPPTMTGRAEPTSVRVVLGPQGDDPVATFEAEQAASELERRRGLSQRPCMQPGWAMLFEYPESDTLSHQTREMRFPIDLAFIDSSRRVVELRRDISPGADEIVTSSQPAKFVLETEEGGLDGVAAGDLASW